MRAEEWSGVEWSGAERSGAERSDGISNEPEPFNTSLQSHHSSSLLNLLLSFLDPSRSITTGDGGDAYNKPGFICYLNHTILVFMFPLIWLALRLHPSNKKTFMEHLEVWRGMYSWRQVSWVVS